MENFNKKKLKFELKDGDLSFSKTKTKKFKVSASVIIVLLILLGVSAVSATLLYGFNRINVADIPDDPLHDPEFDDRNEIDQLTAFGTLKDANSYIDKGYYENIYINGQDNFFYLLTNYVYYNITIKCGYYEGNVSTVTLDAWDRPFLILDTNGYYSAHGFSSNNYIRVDILIEEDIPFDMYISKYDYVNNGSTYSKENPFYLDWYDENAYGNYYWVDQNLDNQWFALWREAGDSLITLKIGNVELYYHEELLFIGNDAQSYYCPYTGYYTIQINPINREIVLR